MTNRRLSTHKEHVIKSHYNHITGELVLQSANHTGTYHSISATVISADRRDFETRRVELYAKIGVSPQVLSDLHSRTSHRMLPHSFTYHIGSVPQETNLT